MPASRNTSTLASTRPPFSAPRLIKLNVPLAEHLGLDPIALASPHGVEILAGNRVADGSEPLAQAYAGHQFGHFVPQLGDGRANLLGEVIARDGLRYDIQLKGSGPTAFSRRGDGRAALGPVLREYILSESMAALGVPTTRALAAVLTGDRVLRETVPARCRLHPRRGQPSPRRHLPVLRRARQHASTQAASRLRHRPPLPRPSRLTTPLSRPARWRHQPPRPSRSPVAPPRLHPRRYEHRQHLHLRRNHRLRPLRLSRGLRTGQSLQLHRQPGPLRLRQSAPRRPVETSCASPKPSCPSSNKRKARRKQPSSPPTNPLTAFAPKFESARLDGLRHKLGLFTEQPSDEALAQDLLDRMAANRADFTLTFRRLAESAANPASDAQLRSLFTSPAAFDAWAAQWRQRLALEPAFAPQRANFMRTANPAIIPRNHFVQTVIDAAVTDQNYQPFEDLLEATSRPYSDRPELAQLHHPRPPRTMHPPKPSAAPRPHAPAPSKPRRYR